MALCAVSNDITTDVCAEAEITLKEVLGVRVTCSDPVPGNGFQRLLTLAIIGSQHSGSLEKLTSFNFPSLQQFQVLDTGLTGALPASLQGPALVRLEFSNNPGIRSTIPLGWSSLPGGEPRFPVLDTLYLSRSRWLGQLPGVWGAPTSFPNLTVLYILGPSEDSVVDSDDFLGLSGGIPDAWLVKESFPALKVRFDHIFLFNICLCSVCKQQSEVFVDELDAMFDTT
jgi:hypothetical protein